MRKTKFNIDIVIEYVDYTEDQLKDLLDSINDHAKFPHHIYLVVSVDQIYKWLSDYMVDIVYYKDIRIEGCDELCDNLFLPNIKDLSERFIYLSDGVFFSDIVTCDDFFKYQKCNIYSNNRYYDPLNDSNKMFMYHNTCFIYDLLNIKKHKYEYQDICRGCLPLIKSTCIGLLNSKIHEIIGYKNSSKLDIYLYGLYLERLGYSNYNQITIKD